MKKQKEFKVGDKVSFIRINRNTHDEAYEFAKKDDIKTGVIYEVTDVWNKADDGLVNWIKVGGDWYHPSDNFKLIK